MIEEIVNNKKLLDKSILEKHITRYIWRIGIVITFAFAFLFLADVGVSIFVYLGYLSFQLKSIKGGTATYAQFLSWQILIQVLTVIPFIVYFTLFKRVNFSQKKTLLCVLTLSTTAVLCFCHWKNPYISFLLSIPVVITSPLDKKRNRITLAISLLLIILYALFHNLFHDPQINYLMAAIATTTLIMFFVVSRKIHITINEIFVEVNEYKNRQEVLYDKIAHDVLTGAFSKSALENDLKNLEKYKSMAFLDVDKFKDINDKKGHPTGDSILKLLTICGKTKNIDIYRYGGDEFVLLSDTYDAKEMADFVEINKKKLNFSAKELYNCEITLSVGILNINQKETPEWNIKKADELMYMSKRKGRNKITILE